MLVFLLFQTVTATQSLNFKRRCSHTLDSIDAQYTKKSIEQCSLKCLITTDINCVAVQYASDDNSCKLSASPLVEDAAAAYLTTVYTYEGELLSSLYCRIMVALNLPVTIKIEETIPTISND